MQRQYFILRPLGWTVDRIRPALDTAPHMLGQLVKIDQFRMHLMALGLAHLPGEITPEIASLLLAGSRREILDFALCCRPAGINRALHRLPATVLTAENYRNLIELLADAAAAKYLNHTASIKQSAIIGLHSLPGSLRRPAIIKALDRPDRLERFVDGLRILAERAALPFDILTSHLGSLNQPQQVAAKIRQLADRLPLPRPLPPEIGTFRRVDSVIEIRAIAKKWRNCLADHLYEINNGTSAVYLCQQCKTVCLVVRYGRLGWFLMQAKGPHNSRPRQLMQIHGLFASAGIPHSDAIDGIRSILLREDWLDYRYPLHQGDDL